MWRQPRSAARSTNYWGKGEYTQKANGERPGLGGPPVGPFVGRLGRLGGQHNLSRSDRFLDGRRFQDQIVADEGDVGVQVVGGERRPRGRRRRFHGQMHFEVIRGQWRGWVHVGQRQLHPLGAQRVEVGPGKVTGNRGRRSGPRGRSDLSPGTCLARSSSTSAPAEPATANPHRRRRRWGHVVAAGGGAVVVLACPTASARLGAASSGSHTTARRGQRRPLPCPRGEPCRRFGVRSLPGIPSSFCRTTLLKVDDAGYRSRRTKRRVARRLHVVTKETSLSLRANREPAALY